MADNRVITIARGYGSGGRTIGQMLAKDMGWGFYDKELLQMASDDSGISEGLFAKADENAHRSLFSRGGDVLDGKVIPPDSGAFTSDENLFRYQAKIIRQLAATENCIIVGRCADYILKDEPNVLRLYIHAPFDACIRAVMQRDGISQEEAAKQIREIDKRRGDYYKQFTGTDWQDADHYDLCLNSARLGWDRCLELVKGYLQLI